MGYMKLGFIGTGNMGGAIIRGYIAAKSADAKPSDLVAAFDKDGNKLAALAAGLGIDTKDSIPALAGAAEAVVLAVKPNNFEEVLPVLAPELAQPQIVISMAAGISIAYMESFLGADRKIVRIMPNTPAMVGSSMTAVSRNANVTDSEFASVLDVFKSIGRATGVDESLMDVVTGLSGSSPAYVYMFIDALAKCAAANGIDDPLKAREFAAQAVLGAAKMVLETGVDPVTLRENVCSPGGATIEAVNRLFANGFEQNIAEGMQAAIDKSKLMTK
jgi:pyrroline-5-carboxylate reductase